MDLIALVKEGFQSVAEHAASYKFGQTVLRHVDKALWVVEKCARWAVPPPLDPEERPQPELVRPLPWVFFLMMLVTLRVTRESISLVNLVLGKPPLRSADVVTYIQGKRRYLRTLKYQGNRMMRARTGTTREPWYNGVRSLFEFTMCFKRQSVQYGNNNTMSISNNDEVLVVKKSKRARLPESPTASTSEACMERLIEKMMVDLDADSDEDSSYTLTNATSVKSDRSVTAESDTESTTHDESAPAPAVKSDQNETPDTPEPQVATKPDTHDNIDNTPTKEATPEPKQNLNSEETALNAVPQRRSPMADSHAFLQSERIPRSPKREQKIANGRTVKSTSERDIGIIAWIACSLTWQQAFGVAMWLLVEAIAMFLASGRERRDAAAPRAASAEFTSRGRKENFRQTP